MQPVVRPEVFDAYWRFAAERQQIFARRAANEPSPWTDDPILAHFKFCNAYRASDRVSQYLIREVIYSPESETLTPEDTFMRIVLFRLFSREDTWELLEQATGGVRISTMHTEHLGDLLERTRRTQPIYTAAFILCAADPYGYPSKHRNHLELIRRMFAPGGVGRDLARARSLEEIYLALIEWPMIGPFLGYQLAVDLNYSPHLDFSENDFTMPGPGAERGLQKVFVDPVGKNAQQLIMHMVEQQEDEFSRLGLRFEGLFGRPLHAIDCQGLFCEIDKYSRVAFPDLKSNRSRIKQVHSPSPRPLPLFFPPKWNINHRIQPLSSAPVTPSLEVTRQLSLLADDRSSSLHAVDQHELTDA